MILMIEQFGTVFAILIYTYEQLVTPQGRKNWVECPSYD